MLHHSAYDPYRFTNPIAKARAEGVRPEPAVFSEKKLFEPIDLSAGPRPSGPCHVGILGAGAAGLVAAYELGALGYQVTVLEMADKVGGRLRSVDFGGGIYGELGGMRIPEVHRTTMHYLDELGLTSDRYRFFNKNPNAFAHLRGERLRLGQSLGELLALPAFSDLEPSNFPFTHPDQQLFGVYGGIIGKLVAAFSEDDAMWSIFSNKLNSGAAWLDEGLFNQFLFRHKGLDEGAIEILGNLSGMLQYERNGLIEAWIGGKTLVADNFWTLKGGLERMMQAFADQIAAMPHVDLRLRHRVDAVTATEAGMSIMAADLATGGRTKVDVDYVLCTLPTPRCQTVDFHPIDHAKRHCWAGMTYTSSGKTLLYFKERFWEQAGIAGGGSFTDRSVQSVYYPSDNAIESDVHFLPGRDELDDDADDGVRGAPVVKDAERAHGPGVLTASYTWEQRARRLHGLMDDDEKLEIILGDLEAIHGPDLPEGRRVADYLDKEPAHVRHIFWDQDAGVAGGALAHFTACDHQRRQDALTRPIYVDGRPRVFFAGEHVAVLHAWIQGALQTSLAATAHILKTAAE